MGELHLEIIVDRLLTEFKVSANVGKPQVAYKETIGTTAKAEGKFDQLTGAKGQYGHVVIEVAPLEEVKELSSSMRLTRIRYLQNSWEPLKKAFETVLMQDR